MLMTVPLKSGVTAKAGSGMKNGGSSVFITYFQVKHSQKKMLLASFQSSNAAVLGAGAGHRLFRVSSEVRNTS